MKYMISRSKTFMNAKTLSKSQINEIKHGLIRDDGLFYIPIMLLNKYHIKDDNNKFVLCRVAYDVYNNGIKLPDILYDIYLV